MNEIFLAVAFFLVLVLVPASIRLRDHRRSSRRLQLKGFLATHNGRLIAPGVVSAGGVEVPTPQGPARVHYRADGDGEPFTIIIFPLGLQLPPLALRAETGLGLDLVLGAQDIQVGARHFDGSFRITGHEPGVVRLLQPEVQYLITKLWPSQLPDVAHLEVRSSPPELQIQVAGWHDRTVELESLFNRIEALIEGLHQAWTRDLAVLAERHGLALTQPSAGTELLKGEVGGHRVRIAIEMQADRWATDVTVATQGPAGLWVRPKREGGEATGSPVLDMLVSVDRASPEVKALLSRDEVAEAMLAVVHAHDGAEITERTVHVAYSGPHDAERLGDVLEACLRAARVVAG